MFCAGCAVPTSGTSSEPGADSKADSWRDVPAHCVQYEEPQKIAKVKSERAEELSGLASSRQHLGILWSHNDSGGTRHLIAFNTEGEPYGNYKLVGSDNRDWEDIAIGPGPYPFRDYLYVADIGDNDLDRDEVVIYRVVEPDVVEQNDDTVDLEGYESFELYYGDKDEHDAESLAIDPESGAIFIVTKSQKGDRDTLLFKAEPPFEDGERYELELVAEEDELESLDGQASGAAFTPSGSTLGILFHKHVSFWTRPLDGWLDGLPDEEPCVGPVADGQVEAFAWATDRPGYFMVPEGEEPNIYHVAPEQ